MIETLNLEKRPSVEGASDEKANTKRIKVNRNSEREDNGDSKYNSTLEEFPRVKKRAQRYTGGVTRTITTIPTSDPLPLARLTPSFSYLHLAEGEIRLFRIHPGSKTDQLRGTLVHAPLSSVKDRYEALSYVWGFSRAAETMKVRLWSDAIETGDKDFALQANLHAALRQLRDEKDEVVIWADALCINQLDAKERSEQVRRMADIYRCAANVIVWLGESSFQTKAAMRTISAMLTPGFFSKIKSYDWNDVHILLQNEWFSRRWVVQEIVSAKTATVVIGEDQVDWRDFADAVELFELYIDDISNQLRQSPRHKYDTDPLGSLNHSGALELIRSTKRIMPLCIEQLQIPRRNLEWLLTSLKALQTADPRDTVYAFLAIAADGGAITPDYDKSLLEVIMDVVVHVINQSSSLDILLRHWLPVSQEISSTNQDLVGTNSRNLCSSSLCFPSESGDTGVTVPPRRRAGNMDAFQPLDASFTPVQDVQDVHTVQSNLPRTGSLTSIKSEWWISTEPQVWILNQAQSRKVNKAQNWTAVRPERRTAQWSNNLHASLVEYLSELFPIAQANTPSWIRSGDGLPFGDSRARSTRRINANPLVGLPGETYYNVCKGKPAEARFGKIDSDSCCRSWCSRSLGIIPRTQTSNNLYNGVIYAQGVELGEISDLSARMADGLALQECLEMGGFSLRHTTDGQDVPDRLWRTLVAGRDSNGRPASSIYRLAFVNLATQISEHRSIDPGELLSTKLDTHIRNFVARMEEVVWNRRIFKGTPRIRVEGGVDELFGLAPQHARMDDKICLLYGCSVPVVLRECGFKNFASTNGEKYYELVGEAYIDGFMEGQAFEGEYGEVLEGSAREFALC